MFPLYRIAFWFRNDPSHFAVQWKQKRCWIDLARFQLPFGAIYTSMDKMIKIVSYIIYITFPIKSIDLC